jgi:hypothetical protein
MTKIADSGQPEYDDEPSDWELNVFAEVAPLFFHYFNGYRAVTVRFPLV